MSASPKTTRVTTGGSASEICDKSRQLAISLSIESCGRVVVIVFTLPADAGASPCR